MGQILGRVPAVACWPAPNLEKELCGQVTAREGNNPKWKAAEDAAGQEVGDGCLG